MTGRMKSVPRAVATGLLLQLSLLDHCEKLDMTRVISHVERHRHPTRPSNYVSVVGTKGRVRGPRKAARDICGTSEVWRKQLNTCSMDKEMIYLTLTIE